MPDPDMSHPQGHVSRPPTRGRRAGPACGRAPHRAPGWNGERPYAAIMRDFDAFERELWAGRAGVYERGFARLTAHTIGPLLDAAGVGPGTRMLEVGTGPGLVSAEAVRRGA